MRTKQASVTPHIRLLSWLETHGRVLDSNLIGRLGSPWCRSNLDLSFDDCHGRDMLTLANVERRANGAYLAPGADHAKRPLDVLSHFEQSLPTNQLDVAQRSRQTHTHMRI